MTLELGSLLGAVALVAIPLVTWLSGRFTKEARLLHRIERWGKAYAALPESEARIALGESLVSVGSELSSWIDVNSRIVRRQRNWASLGVFVIAISAGIALQSALADGEQTWSFVLLTGCGVAAGVLSVVLSELVERRASARARAEDQSLREAAFRAGTSINVAKSWR